MKGNFLYIQSGGPTSVINCSALGVISKCKSLLNKKIKLYASKNSFYGILNNNIIDVFKEDEKQLKLLNNTPGAIFGSSRYKMVEDDYHIFINNLKDYNIRHLLINGGNGTSKACIEIYKHLKSLNYDCSIIGIPKTVDNDIPGVDHTPGYASAARHIILSILGLHCELNVYDSGLIMIIEVMGRNTGWLAASCILANKLCGSPDLIYTPERVFDFYKFINDIKNVYSKKNKCMVIISEGVKTKDGKYLFDSYDKRNPELNMGGILNTIYFKIKDIFPCKIRTIDLNLMQRNAARDCSVLDKKEAFVLGEEAVRISLKGETNRFVALDRISSKPYKTRFIYPSCEELANGQNILPDKYIINEGTFIDDSFLDYIVPLVGKFNKYTRLSYFD